MLEPFARRRLPALLAALTASMCLAAAGFAAAQAQPKAPAAAAAPAPLKVAFVLPSPVGQSGWSYQHNQGRLAMEAALGGQVRATVVEGVAEGSAAERVLRDLAVQGHPLIFAAGPGYAQPVLRVAAEFPNVKFELVGSGQKTAANVNTYNARWYEARYLAGLLAGKSSTSGNAGYVAAFPVPEVVQGINAFALGMRAVNPKAQVRVAWLNSWMDPAREREAALALVSQGADVLTHHSGSAAVAQVAQENFKTKGVKFIAYQSDMLAFAPDAQLAAVTQHWGSYYTNVAQAVLLKQWKATPVWGGMKDDLVQLSALQLRLPQDVRVLLDARRKAIVGGSLKPFAAPLTDSEGKTRLASGALDDAAILGMNWYVQGVVVGAPKP